MENKNNCIQFNYNKQVSPDYFDMIRTVCRKTIDEFQLDGSVIVTSYFTQITILLDDNSDRECIKMCVNDIMDFMDTFYLSE